MPYVVPDWFPRGIEVYSSTVQYMYGYCTLSIDTVYCVVYLVSVHCAVYTVSVGRSKQENEHSTDFRSQKKLAVTS